MSVPKRPKIQTGHRASGEAYYYLRGLSMNGKKALGEAAESRDASATAPKARKGRKIRVPSKQKPK